MEWKILSVESKQKLLCLIIAFKGQLTALSAFLFVKKFGYFKNQIWQNKKKIRS